MLAILSIKDNTCQGGLSCKTVDYGVLPRDHTHMGRPNRLKYWRDKRGWSQERLGDEVGLSHGYVGKLERGDADPSIGQLRQFAKALNCSPADLLLDEDREPVLSPIVGPHDDGPAFVRFEPDQTPAMAWPIRLRRDGGDAFSPRGCMWFGHGFLSKLELDPTQCVVLDARDSSMAPAFPAGTTFLIDQRRQKRKPEAVYGVKHGGAEFIRRAHKKGNRWHLVADNPDAKWDVPWDATIHSLGRVVWTARVTVS